MSKPVCLAERLKQLLDETGLSKAELSRLSGISESIITHYINDTWEAKHQEIFAMAKAANVNEAWLMGYNAPRERTNGNAPETAEARKIFAENLNRIANERSVTQSDIAVATGCSSTSVSNWFLGKKYPRPNKVPQIAEFLGVRISDLVETPLPEDAYLYMPTHRIPILRRISNNLPIYTKENIEGYTYTELNHGAEYFALRVRGDSMNAAHILDGQVLICRHQDIVNNGEIAVVLVGDDDATVKRFYQVGDTVILLPQSTNPEHMPQVYNSQKVCIVVQGKVMQSVISY